MSDVTVHVVGLDVLAEVLRAAQADIIAEERKVASKGALNIKNDWRAGWSGMPHIRALPIAIGYDLAEDADSVSAVIGPDKDKSQGPLGNIIEFADGSIKSAPHPAGAHALELETPRFVDAVGKAAADLLEKR